MQGPLVKRPGNDALISLLSGTPKDCLIIPILIRGNVIALLYADNGNASVLTASLTYFDTLATMASLSFEIIMLRQKLLDLLVPTLQHQSPLDFSRLIPVSLLYAHRNS
ncbi:hypothetical protein NBG4_1420002 [Candidatus Sulfobium mesophilum]|uniref:GAF domain-containing protein n=1 Tax=Candidatus Sulfobium mesophilum TaxID=2016548 RepID=A0A2U3QF95_9BACT|nr:hypothetical protein NBG4_1420002 [Candidatus Sulfobium mesophilum]